MKVSVASCVVIACLWGCEQPVQAPEVAQEPVPGTAAQTTGPGFEPVENSPTTGREVYALDPSMSYVDPAPEAPAWTGSGGGGAWGVAEVGAALDSGAGCDLETSPEVEPTKGCAPLDALAKARLAPGVGVAALERLGHPRAAARWGAALVLGRVRGLDAGAVGAIVARARVESHPVVLTALVVAARGKFSVDPSARDVLLAYTRAPDVRVRRAVVEGLASQIYSGDRPTLTAALEMIDQDPSDDVRAVGCRTLGQRAGKDDAALAKLDVMTSPASTDEALYAPCWEGLINAFAAPALRAPSERAYTMVIERLDATPRAPGRPPHQALRKLASLKSMGSLPGFVEQMGVRELARAIVLDAAPDPNTRGAAVDAFVAFGATREELEQLRLDGFGSVLPAGKGPESYVVRRIEEAKQRAK